MNVLEFLLQLSKNVTTLTEGAATRQLREAILSTGSETEDNLLCANGLEVRRSENDGIEIYCADSGLSLGDFCWQMENEHVVAYLLNEFKDRGVTRSDVSSVLRLLTLISSTVLNE